LIEYPVFEEVGEFLDTIPTSLRRKSVKEYKKFLHLKFLMKDTSCPAILSPSGLIDKVWHTHLLMPNNYAEFCQSVFGQSIDHDLAGSKSPENEKSKRRERTQNLYKVTFNKEPDERFWMQNRTADEQFDPQIFFDLPTAFEVFQPTSPKILKRKLETVTPNKKIQVRVHLQTGKILRITCQENDKIFHVKLEISVQTGFSLWKIRLYDQSTGVGLDEGTTLSACGIEHESDIDLFYEQTGC